MRVALLCILLLLCSCSSFFKRPVGWNYNEDYLYMSGYYRVDITKFKDKRYEITIYDGKTRVIAPADSLWMNGKILY